MNLNYRARHLRFKLGDILFMLKSIQVIEIRKELGMNFEVFLHLYSISKDVIDFTED